MNLKKSLLVVAGAFVLVGGLAALFRYTSVGRDHLEEAMRTTRLPLTREEIAKRFHTAEGRCLRYGTDQVTDTELERVGGAFKEAGVSTDKVAGLAGAFLRWEVDREAAVHALPVEEEKLLLMSEGLPLHLRPVFWLKREALLASLMENLDPLYARGATVLATLSPAQQTRVRAIWEQQPEALSVTSFLQMLRLLQVRETQQRIDVVARRLEEHLRQGAPLPKSLSGVNGLTPEMLRDAWHSPFEYDPTVSGGVRVISRGQDGAVGGTGPKADIIRDVVLNPEFAIEAPPNGPP